MKNSKVRVPRCKMTLTGKHQFVDYRDFFVIPGIFIPFDFFTLVKSECKFCGIIDDRKI